MLLPSSRLFGGGALFRTLLHAGLADTVEVAVIPVLLGGGSPFLAPVASAELELADKRTLPEGRHRGTGELGPGWPEASPRIRYLKRDWFLGLATTGLVC